MQVPQPSELVTLPGRQSMHAEMALLPGTGLALPGSHARHESLLDAPRSGLYVPAVAPSKAASIGYQLGTRGELGGIG